VGEGREGRDDFFSYVIGGEGGRNSAVGKRKRSCAYPSDEKGEKREKKQFLQSPGQRKRERNVTLQFVLSQGRKEKKTDKRRSLARLESCRGGAVQGRGSLGWSRHSHGWRSR